ncbi:DUF1643 domain-containing protein [Thalassotalea sp. PS06]|uniref:DUF1643 domain-containing protein n=1 Tax=Thalassotalea sp. PS06 TaxID=2594005 RepID=UPI00163D76D3|nr:DUF1643 domain-containing protein [Thalassotalea sp. PS06]
MRYFLHRGAIATCYGGNEPIILFIGLNPSAADEKRNDPTITRCINIAKDWGYGGVLMTNLFAYCAVRPSEMKAAKKPIGEYNDYWLQHYISKAHRTLLA